MVRRTFIIIMCSCVFEYGISCLVVPVIQRLEQLVKTLCEGLIGFLCASFPMVYLDTWYFHQVLVSH